MRAGDILESSFIYADEEMRTSGSFINTNELHSRFSQRADESLGMLDLSLNTTIGMKFKGSNIRKSDVRNLSITLRPDEMSELWGSKLSLTTTASQLPAEDLFEYFQNIYQNSGNSQHVFEALSSFIEICSGTLENICSGRSLTDKYGNVETESVNISKQLRDIQWLMNERNTWQLVYALYKDRLTYNEVSMNFGAEIHPLSEKELMINFYNSNSFIREAQLVIDWLERNARDEWKLLKKGDVSHYTDKTVAWENTLCQLQSANMAYKSSRPIVQSLDPDAPLRESRPLHDLDTDDEKRLLRQVFLEIRCGQIGRAQQLCMHCGQAWRAATLEGWRLFHDPNFREQSQESKLPIEGNPNRHIWKLSAWRMCSDFRASPEDKAIMGSLCGHLNSLLPFCKSWEDLLWAYTKTTVDIAVEKEIRDNSVKDFVEMPEQYWNNSKTMEGIMKEVRACDEGKRPERIVQELIILGSIPELILHCSTWIDEQCQPQLLRFLVHLILILRLFGYSEPQHLGDKLIKAYVKVMKERKDIDKLAFYCSLLPVEEQIEEYSNFMENIDDEEEREHCLHYAEKYKLNVSLLTEQVVNNVRNRQDEIELDETLSRKISKIDLEKISSLDWVVYYPHQRISAMWECNTLIRDFLLNSRLIEARKAFNKIPTDSPELIMKQFNCELDEHNAVVRESLPAKVDSTLKEYLCYKAYLDAVEGFSHWFHQYHNTKPKPPVQPEGKLAFSESAVYEYKLSRYNQELERWQQQMSHETKLVQTQLYNVVVFPGGWLIDNVIDEEPRKTELEKLRKKCIPEIFLLLHKLFQTSGDEVTALDLVSLVMDESTGYYEIFGTNELKAFLQKLIGSAVNLIANNDETFAKANRNELDSPTEGNKNGDEEDDGDGDDEGDDDDDNGDDDGDDDDDDDDDDYDEDGDNSDENNARGSPLDFIKRCEKRESTTTDVKPFGNLEATSESSQSEEEESTDSE